MCLEIGLAVVICGSPLCSSALWTGSNKRAGLLYTAQYVSKRHAVALNRKADVSHYHDVHLRHLDFHVFSYIRFCEAYSQMSTLYFPCRFRHVEREILKNEISICHSRMSNGLDQV